MLLDMLCVPDVRCCCCCAGIRAIAGQDEPIGRQISKMEIADGLILEKVRFCVCSAKLASTRLGLHHGSVHCSTRLNEATSCRSFAEAP